MTLGSKREARHQAASNFCRSFQGSISTTDYILDETFTLLFVRYPGTAVAVMRLLLETVTNGRVILERIDPERFAAACSLRERYADKPRISFTDLTSMVVMTELGITEILTEEPISYMLDWACNACPEPLCADVISVRVRKKCVPPAS